MMSGLIIVVARAVCHPASDKSITYDFNQGTGFERRMPLISGLNKVLIIIAFRRSFNYYPFHMMFAKLFALFSVFFALKYYIQVIVFRI